MTSFIIATLSTLTLVLIGSGIWLVMAERSKKKETAPWPAGEALPVSPIAAPYVARPTPRSPSSAGAGGCFLLFSLGWTGFSLIFVIMPVGIYRIEQQNYTQLRDYGVISEAVVLDRSSESDAEGGTDYYLTYRYTARLPQGGELQLTERERVGADSYHAFPPESRVKVRYVANDPQLVQLEARYGPPSTGFLLCFSAFGGLFVLIGAALLSSAVQTIRHSWVLKQRGQLIQGRVTHRWTETDSDGDTQYCLAYRFQPPGEPEVNQAEYHRQAYDRCEVNDPVQIRYVPGQPKICRLEL